MPDAERASDAAETPADGTVVDEDASGNDSATAVIAPPVPVVADDVLLAAVDFARGALLEVTAPQTVGSVIGHVAEGEHVLSLHFAADLPGYPGWHWSVTLARVEESDPTVLETELLPGERALLAPEWVPWSERLADYRTAQAAAAAAAEGAEDESFDGDDLEDDDLEDDEDREDGGDGFGDDDAGDDAVDGIDIDALDASDASGTADDDVDDGVADDGDDADRGEQSD
jgi:hypothetical protein